MPDREKAWPPDDEWVPFCLPWIEGRCIPERRMNFIDGKWVFESRYPKPSEETEELVMHMDREKVINDLQELHGSQETMELISDVIALLNERDAVEPKQVDLYGKDEWWGLVCGCPDCKAEWMSDKADTHFCPRCGRKVKWE